MAADTTQTNHKNSSDLSDLPIYEEEVRELVDPIGQDDKKSKRPVHVKVSARQGESHEQMLRRFNFGAQDVVQKIKDLQFYEKPSKRRQREEKIRAKLMRRYGR